jgi:hypothetical protein
MNFLEKSLFTTNAIRVAAALSPFWYTSGTLGPYFINTHFLYGSEKDANELLSFIDNNLNSQVSFVREIEKKVCDFYETNELFKNVIDVFYSLIKSNENFNECEYVTGGERRDWFFSPIIAKLSGKKHLYIFKSLDIYSLNEKITDIKGAKVAHIADLITQASSYERAWIPAIKKINGNFIYSASVVDRSQGGKEFLISHKIDCQSAVCVNDDFFTSAKENGVINKEQLVLIKQFAKDPDEYGKNFLIKYPEFFKASLRSSDKSTKSKAERCMKENPYKLDFKKLGF